MKNRSPLTAGGLGLLLMASASVADPIRTFPGLESVTVYEITFSTVPVTYLPGAAELTARLGDPLTAANRDFGFVPEESYDVFYSDADGTLNADGAYLTIEGVWRPGSPREGSMNINEVELRFGGGVPPRFGDFVSSFEYGFGHVIPGSEAEAVDHDLGTFPRFGQTSEVDLSDRFRLTIGWEGISNASAPVPEPITGLLLGPAMATLAWRRWRSGAKSR